MSQRVVEHVWSNGNASRIFRDLFGHFQENQKSFHHVAEGAAESETAEFRIYHRPHREDELSRPCACIVHHDLADPGEAERRSTFLERYNDSDLVICLNSSQARELSIHGINNTVVIPHGFAPSLLDIRRQRTGRTQPPWTLGFFSRRYPRLVKGEAFLYELALRLPPSLIRFKLMGRDRDKDAKYLSALGFEIDCNTNPSYDDIVRGYFDIDALLILSVAEGGPASVPEAAAAGVPIISRPVGMVKDIPFGPTENLKLTDDARIDSLAIQNFLQMDQPSANGPSENTFLVRPWSETIEHYEAVIATTLGNRP